MKVWLTDYCKQYTRQINESAIDQSSFFPVLRKKSNGSYGGQENADEIGM